MSSMLLIERRCSQDKPKIRSPITENSLLHSVDLRCDALSRLGKGVRFLVFAYQRSFLKLSPLLRAKDQIFSGLRHECSRGRLGHDVRFRQMHSSLRPHGVQQLEARHSCQTARYIPARVQLCFWWFHVQGEAGGGTRFAERQPQATPLLTATLSNTAQSAVLGLIMANKFWHCQGDGTTQASTRWQRDVLVVCGPAVAQARLLLQELMTLKGSGAASQAAEIILSNLGCGDVRCVQVAYSLCNIRSFLSSTNVIAIGLLPKHHLQHPFLQSQMCASTACVLNCLPGCHSLQHHC